MVRRRTALVAAFIFSALAQPLAAQCANGSAPPCGRPKPAAHRDPPLDTLTWMVFPFRNVTDAADLNWVSLSSVNQLYIDMSRWTDIHVVDDERVSDLLRDVPEPKRSQLGLDSVRAIARHTGAGRLVMGEFLKSGARIIVTAKIFNTLTGQRVRQVIDTAQTPEAIPSTFSRLAGNVLALPPPPGATIGGLGTRSAGAVREYTLGMLAFNRWLMDTAGTHMRRALAFDPTFALAYLRLSAVHAVYPESAAARAAALAAASRYSAGLPAREQMVIALRQVDTARAVQCDLGGKLVALDSGDADGWLAMGWCHTRAPVLAVIDAEGRVTVAQEWNAARRAFERSLGALQPERSDALTPLMNLYQQGPRTLCVVAVSPPATCPPESSYWGAPVLEGDSIAMHLERVDVFNPMERRRELAAGRRAIVVAANDLAALKVSRNPQGVDGHVWHALLQLRLGDLAGAARELAALPALGGLPGWNARLWAVYSVELELRMMHPERALPLLATLAGDSTVDSPTGAMFMTTMGQFHRDIQGANASPAVRAARVAFLPVYAGVVPTDFERTTQVYAAVAASPAQRDNILQVGTLLAFHALRTRPALDTASAFSLFRFQAFLTLADTVRARRALAEYDLWGDNGADDWFDAHEMFSAESHLELGNTLAAWTRIEPFGRRWASYDVAGAPTTFWGGRAFSLFAAPRVSGRAWLLYADLAMATGHRDEAKRGYTMLIGMWERGDPPVQPLVKRAKESLAKLGGP
jgi:TolB-like protein